MTTLQLSGAWSVDDRRSLRFAVGAITAGTLTDGAEIHEVDSGGALSLGLQYTALRGRSRTPTIDLSADLGLAWAETRGAGGAADYSATDLRIGARTAWTAADAVFPYAAVRLFGGPVRWAPRGTEESGSDAHHYQLAVGAAVGLGPLDVYGEWAGAGERGWSLGLSGAW